MTRNPFKRVVNFIMLYIRWIVFLLIRRKGLTMTGTCNFPPLIPGTPYVMIGNHENYSEAVLLTVLLGNKVKPWVARRAVNFLAYHLTKGIFKYTSDGDLLEDTIRELREGAVYMLLPEGKRNYGVGTRRGSVGLARLMQACNPVVIPIGMSNDRMHNSILDVFREHPNWSVTIGTPFRLANPEERGSKNLNDILEESMLRLARLLAYEKRGYYRGMEDRKFKHTKEINMDEFIAQHNALKGKAKR